MADVLYLIGWNQFVAVLLAAAVWLSCRTKMLGERPALRHGLWLLVLLKLVTPPIIPVPVLPGIADEPRIQAAALPDSVAADTAADRTDQGGHAAASTTARIAAGPSPVAPAGANVVASDAEFSRSAEHFSWRSVVIALLGISLLVSFALWLAAIRQFRQIRRLLRGNSAASGRGVELLREVSRIFNLRSAANLSIVDGPVTPMLWAVPGNSAIVLPRQLADLLGDDQLRFIIAHELGHFVRHDHWANLFGVLVTTLFWWNPIAWPRR